MRSILFLAGCATILVMLVHAFPRPHSPCAEPIGSAAHQFNCVP